MTRTIITMLCVSIALTGCDRLGPHQEKGKPKAAAVKPARKTTVNQPVEDAMMRIPPELRASYQKAFICEVAKAKDAKKAIVVTSAYVADLTRRLQADPGIAKC